MCYEASYIGYTLQRDLAAKGYHFDVVAPTSIPSPRGKQVKTDRIDVTQLVQFYTNDPLFLYHQWQANLRILGVDEIKIVPYTPLSRPFIERLNGTIRREFLDHTLFWNAADLERKLADFKAYYTRCHPAISAI